MTGPASVSWFWIQSSRSGLWTSRWWWPSSQHHSNVTFSVHGEHAVDQRSPVQWSAEQTCHQCGTSLHFSCLLLKTTKRVSTASASSRWISYSVDALLSLSVSSDMCFVQYSFSLTKSDVLGNSANVLFFLTFVDARAVLETSSVHSSLCRRRNCFSSLCHIFVRVCNA